MNAERALELIRRVGIETLGGFDGCLCTHFKVQGVDVNITCRKSYDFNIIDPAFHGITIRVYSHGPDSDGAQLCEVAREVAQQIRDVQGDAIAVRYCDYQHDDKQQCIRCDGQREMALGYLCTTCLAGEPDPAKFDFRLEPDF